MNLKWFDLRRKPYSKYPMVYRLLLLKCLLLFSLLILNTQASELISPNFGHGQFQLQTKKPIKNLTSDLILFNQKHWLTEAGKMIKAAKDINKKQLSVLESKLKIIDQFVDTPLLANALKIDAIAESKLIPVDTHQFLLMDALRAEYLKAFYQKDKDRLHQILLSKGINPAVAEKLEAEGITVYLKTNNGGQDYIDECREAGVPIPPPMFSEPWENRGIFTNEFISELYDSELWLYESDTPDGVCLALPRYASDNTTRLFGIICLGKQTNKACFWDNPRGRYFERNVPIDISNFVGGYDLAANNQGICSDCHAGENPFVVHPDKAPFSGLTSTLSSTGWYEPIVADSWPNNPGPINILDAIASSGRCNSCHRVGGAGRFPDVSQLNFYCDDVLNNAVDPGSKRTMPPSSSTTNYLPHINALKAACDVSPGQGVEVEIDPIPDDESIISPVLVMEPLYACSTKVWIKGAVLDAKVSVLVNGSEVNSVISRSPDYLVIDVPELNVGDQVTAFQEYEGILSDESATVIVKDYREDHPSGLPTPAIDPELIYECGHTIAVRHIKGAKLTVWVNGTDERSLSTGTDWTGLYPGKSPFDAGDSFTAQVSLCSDTSSLSPSVAAVSAPSSISAPEFDPSPLFEGQELVTLTQLMNGSLTEIYENIAGNIGKFSTPVSWFPEFDLATPMGRPVQMGDDFTATQRLCEISPRPENPRILPCRELPAPKIFPPIIGTDYVVVTESVPGARIRIYDDDGKEIGDGSGTVVQLIRTLTGVDKLTVIQQVDDCISSSAYVIYAQHAGKGNNQDN